MQADSISAEPKHRGEYGFLSRKEAALALGVSVKTIDALTRSGQLPARRMGQRIIRYWRQDLDAFAQGTSNEGEQ